MSENTLCCILDETRRVRELLEPQLAAQQQGARSIVEQVRTADTQEGETLSLVGGMGRPAKSFTLTNLQNTAAIYFETTELRAEQQQSVGPLYLLPNTTRTFLRETEIVRVKAVGDGPAWVQVDVL